MTSQNAPAPGAGDVNKKDDSAAALKEYPYNLLYAQQMMNMAQSQAHQWEVYAFLLNQQLQMNRMESLLLLQSGAVPTLSAPDFQAMQSAVSQAAPEGATAEEQANFHAQALAAVAAAAATVPTATADANTPKPVHFLFKLNSFDDCNVSIIINYVLHQFLSRCKSTFLISKSLKLISLR